MSASTRSGVPSPSDAVSISPTRPGGRVAGDLLVVRRADLFERVRERIVADVVQQRGDRAMTRSSTGIPLSSPRSSSSESVVRAR